MTTATKPSSSAPPLPTFQESPASSPDENLGYGSGEEEEGEEGNEDDEVDTERKGAEQAQGHEKPLPSRPINSAFLPPPTPVLPTPTKNVRMTVLPAFRSFFEASVHDPLFDDEEGENDDGGDGEGKDIDHGDSDEKEDMFVTPKKKNPFNSAFLPSPPLPSSYSSLSSRPQWTPASMRKEKKGSFLNLVDSTVIEQDYLSLSLDGDEGDDEGSFDDNDSLGLSEIDLEEAYPSPPPPFLSLCSPCFFPTSHSLELTQ